MLKNTFLRSITGALLVVGNASFTNPDPAPTDPLEVIRSYPKDYFIAPVTDPLLVTGTFCELRPNHFHGGLDMKSKNGAVGQPVFAAADGYIDQVKVQSGGYGNVVYIKHPNGYSTVYAHLDAFSTEITKIVRETQYKRERFEVVIDLPKDKVKVKKGEEIAKMGNSGSSTGPHLHFEIRNAHGKTLNPLLFGLPVPDTRPPDLRDMKVYFLNEQRGVNMSKAFPIEKRKDGSYGLKGGATSIRLGAWRVGFGVKAYDESNSLRNDNGIFALSLFANEHLVYQWMADELDFDESRYLNAHTDYAAHENYGAWFHRLFVLPGDQLTLYDHTETLGAIALSAEQPTKITLKVLDAAGNSSTISFDAYRDTSIEMPAPQNYQYDFGWNQENQISTADFSMHLAKGTLYDDVKFQFSTTPDQSTGVYSPVFHLHNEATPVHKYFDISMLPTGLPDHLRPKAVIVQCDNKRPENCGGAWKEGKLTTRIRSFGDYCIMVDDIPPTISPVVFESDMRKKTSMAFRISDNFGVSGQAEQLNWRGTIDGAWVLFEYDSKRARLTHRFDGRIAPGQHTLRLVVKDDRNNEKVFEGTFTR